MSACWKISWHRQKYDTDKTELGNKISDTTWLFKNTDYSAKITAIEDKIPSISGLASNGALTVVENQIMTQKLLKLRGNLLIMIMIKLLLLQSLKI